MQNTFCVFRAFCEPFNFNLLRLKQKSPAVKNTTGLCFNSQLPTATAYCLLATVYLTINSTGLLQLLMPLVPRLRT